MGQMCAYIDDGKAAIAWPAPNEVGLHFDTCGENRRAPVDLDCMPLVALGPEAGLSSGLDPIPDPCRRGR